MFQSSLTNGKEPNAKKSFEDTVKFFLNIDYLRFGEYYHKLKTKIVLDMSASWKVVKRYIYKILKANEKDIIIEVEKQLQTTVKDGKEKMLDSCILCCVEVKPCKCKNSQPWNKNKNINTNGEQCFKCFNVIQNFGAVSY